jgi:ABC-2 type transport system permease protein
LTELRGVYTLWQREIKRFIRDRARVVISFIQPLLWLVVFAAGFGAKVSIPGISYQQFLFPGIIGQTLLFTSMFMGISVIWDKEFGFMKEILVAPISRFSIFIGKMFGDSTAAMLQGVIVFAFGFLLGIPFNPVTLLAALPVMLLITFGLVSIGLIIASFMGSLENFGAIQTFINLPLFFLSGALFPTSGPGVPELPQALTP